MALTPGTRLGSYEITGLIGAGGMGEVYRAADTNLKRQVAIKVLPQAVAQDADRLARFQREAEVLAALNHPNIAAIYGLDRAEGQTALVMELVEGPTLGDRIAQGAIPLDEALPIARQIAVALEAAHEQGIVHRDLKPANIKVRPDGTVKVLDFGLAKAMEPERVSSSPGVSQSPTITTPAMTQIGLILGTAAYMSPEQARGKAVDKRTDIWAFGCVLYEMLTGRRVFEGDDVTDVLVSVLSKYPDWTALPAATPPAVRRLLRRSLERDPRRRVADMADARLDLEDAESEPAGAMQPNALPPVPMWQRSMWPAIAIGAAAVAASVAWMSRPSVALPVSRFAVTLSPGDEFTAVEATRQAVAVSPDGSHIAYMANARIYVRARDQLRSAPITDAGAHPFFSPDGRSIAFWQRGQLKRVAVNGGAPVVVTDTPQIWGATWSADDTILYGMGAGGIWRVPAAGGKAENIVKLDAGQRAHGPQLLPGGRSLVFTLLQGSTSWDDAQIVVHSLDTGARQVVVQGGTDGRYLPTGHLVYVRQGSLLAQPFDIDTLQTRGAAMSLVGEVALSFSGATGAAHYSVAGDGTLVYVPSSSLDVSAVSLVWVDRKGQETLIPGGEGLFTAPALSMDGARVALNRMATGGNSDVWTFAVRRGVLEPLATDPGRDADPIWSPDGSRIAYASSSHDGGPGIFVRAADGTGKVERLTTGTHVPSSWSLDGTRIVYADFGSNAISASAQADLAVVSVNGDRRAEKLLTSPHRLGSAVISPDSRWLAYESSETGEKVIFVRPFPDVTKMRARISPGGGMSPVWARDGRTLFYRNGRAIMSVAVRGTTPDEWGAPEQLFEGSYFFVDGPPMFDVAPDGRFLMLKPITGNPRPQALKTIIVVQNWYEELKRLAPTN